MVQAFLALTRVGFPFDEIQETGRGEDGGGNLTPESAAGRENPLSGDIRKLKCINEEWPVRRTN